LVRIGSGTEDDLESRAVTDSQRALFERRLGAASAGADLQDLQRVGAGGVQPEDVADLGVLRHETEIKFRLGYRELRSSYHGNRGGITVGGR